MLRTALLSLLVLTMTLCVLSQTKNHLLVSTSVHLVVTDPSGRKMGVDSRISKPYDQWTWYREIPNATIGFNNTNESESSSTEFEAFTTSPHDDGTFKIELIGDTICTSFLLVYATPQNNVGEVQRASYRIRTIPVDKDSVVTYLFTYHAARPASVSLVKVVSARSLVQDIAAMQKLRLITDRRTADKYTDLVRVYATSLQHHDITGARSTLTNIIHSIAADSAGTLAADACKSLRSDFESLLQQR